MYAYKAEILKAGARDAGELDSLLNRSSAEGRYDCMAAGSQIKGAFIGTFRKEI